MRKRQTFFLPGGMGKNFLERRDLTKIQGKFLFYQSRQLNFLLEFFQHGT
jgi:hypothetical protein